MENDILPRELLEQGILYFKTGKYNEAKLCWEKSANKGIASAMFCMGVLCLREDRKDIEKARIWFEKADKAGHKNAKIQLDNLEKYGKNCKSIDYLFHQKINVKKIDKKIIKFGGYEWYILKKNNNRCLCVSRYIIDIRQFHTTCTKITWKDSDIRYWLNNDFYLSFNECNRTRILEVELENIDNPIYGIRAGENTRDYIFLLSYQELIDSFICQINYDKECDLISMKQNNDDLVAFVKMENKNITEASQKYGLDYNLAQNQAIGWWLRTPGANENRCVRVNCNGAIRLHGREVDRCLVGIRPALWLEERDG